MSDPPMQPPPLPLEPLRVEPLAYHTAMYGPVRPGLLVAVGILSILFGGISILASSSELLMSVVYRSMRLSMATSTITMNTAMVRATAPPTPVMMAPAARAIAITGLSRRANLTGLRIHMLDQLLASAGDQMFPFSDSAITAEKVADNVAASGLTTAPDGSEAIYFVVANGRIEVSDNSASFSPTRGATVNVYDASTTATNNQVTPAPPAPIAPTTMFVPGPISTHAIVLNAIASVLNVLLAIYLVTIGIMVLCNARRGRYLHLVYAGLKIPCAGFAGIAYSMMLMQLMGGLAGGSAGMLGGVYFVQSMIACIYPISLLIVMNTRGVREYYRSIA